MAFLLVSTILLYLYDYRQRTAEIDGQIGILYAAQVPGIVEALWNYDRRVLQALADGLRSHPYVNFVAIEDAERQIVSSGARNEGRPSRSYLLVRKLPGREAASIGKLILQVDSSLVLADTARQVFVALSFQVIFLIVVSLIVLFLFSRTVTRHLDKIAAYIAEFGIRPGTPPLELDKRDRGDELDVLALSFNAMRADIDASRSAELRTMEELTLSEERYRILVDEAPDAIMMFDVGSGRFVSCNRRAEALFGRSGEELLRSAPGDLYAPLQPDGLSAAESVAQATSRALLGEHVMLQRHIVQPSGRLVVCETRFAVIPPAEKKVLRVSYLDITDRVRAEEEVARSLREKEVLLQEVYHRTKNNMQIIASFLGMEAIESGDERLRGILDKMIGRITSMALIHQKLYESKDLSRIDLGDYLVDLVQEIRNAFLADRPEVDVRVQAEAGIVALLDMAIPCGLALNELIVNAVKYAFPGGRAGTIRVGLSRGRPGTIAFSVEDDGVGLPPGYDFRKDGGIGLQTVVSIIESQLRGSITFGAGPGASYTAVIAENLYRARI